MKVYSLIMFRAMRQTFLCIVGEIWVNFEGQTLDYFREIRANSQIRLGPKPRLEFGGAHDSPMAGMSVNDADLKTGGGN